DDPPPTFDYILSLHDALPISGVTIMAGTDAGFLNSFNYPGIALHEELALFVEKGLTPAQALAAATRAGPAWFGKLDRYGSIEVRSEEHTSELQSRENLVCRLL